jgi:hypothetical protein
MNDQRDDLAPDPAAALAIIEQQRRQAGLTRVSNAVLFAVWGLAWLVGYGALWLSGRHGEVSPASALVFGACVLVGLVATFWHVTRRMRGIVGSGPRTGAMFAGAWVVGYAAQGMTIGGLARAGASDDVVQLVANASGALVVGLLFLAGGMMWRSPGMYGLGAWMCLVAGAAALVGLPGSYLVMALAGGGGMLVASGLEAVLRRGADRA